MSEFYIFYLRYKRHSTSSMSSLMQCQYAFGRTTVNSRPAPYRLHQFMAWQYFGHCASNVVVSSPSTSRWSALSFACHLTPPPNVLHSLQLWQLCSLVLFKTVQCSISCVVLASRTHERTPPESQAKAAKRQRPLKKKQKNVKNFRGKKNFLVNMRS